MPADIVFGNYGDRLVRGVIHDCKILDRAAAGDSIEDKVHRPNCIRR